MKKFTIVVFISLGVILLIALGFVAEAVGWILGVIGTALGIGLFVFLVIAVIIASVIGFIRQWFKRRQPKADPLEQLEKAIAAGDDERIINIASGPGTGHLMPVACNYYQERFRTGNLYDELCRIARADPEDIMLDFVGETMVEAMPDTNFWKPYAESVSVEVDTEADCRSYLIRALLWELDQYYELPKRNIMEKILEQMHAAFSAEIVAEKDERRLSNLKSELGSCVAKLAAESLSV